MFPTAIIVLREVLEAALVIGLVLVAARGLRGRGYWVGGGVAAGLGGAVIVAAFAGVTASAVQGIGQELFNAAILFFAVGMLAWHNVWMARHGAALATEIKAVGRDVVMGTRPQYLLATVVGVAVLREGSEVVLFLYGIAVAQHDQAASMWTGAALGLVLGAAAGLLFYFGLMRIASRHLFRVTGWLIALLAAGMAAQAAGFLVQADLLPALQQPLWDSSSLLSLDSLFGRVLQALVGYIDRPSGMQVLFYTVTLVTIFILGRLFGSVPGRTSGSLPEVGA